MNRETRRQDPGQDDEVPLPAAQPLAAEYFGKLDAQAQPTFEDHLSLDRVEPCYDRGWLLVYSSAEGRVLTLEAAPDTERSVARSEHFGFSYRKSTGVGDPDEEWEVRMGLELAKSLAGTDVGAPPEAVLSPPERSEATSRLTTTILLSGDCDRACRFCAWGVAKSGSSRSGIHPWVPSIMRVISALNSVTGNPSLAAERRRIESRLRRVWNEAPDAVIVWSGVDCLGSPIFDPLLQFAHELGFRGMSVQSPGSRLADAATVDFLERHSVGEVSLTAHGSTAATFDASAGKPGASALFWTALDLLLARNLSVKIEVPCYVHNVHELGMILRDIHQRPVSISVFFWYPDDSDRNMFSQLPLKHEVAVEALAEVATWIEPGRVSVGGIPTCAFPPGLKEHYYWDYPGHHLSAASFGHAEVCVPCPERAVCPGFARVYSEEFIRRSASDPTTLP